MIPFRRRVEKDGTISMGEVLKLAKIHPGDFVEIIPGTNKITIRVTTDKKAKGVVRSVAGKWKDRPDLVKDLLKLRDEEDDRSGTTLD